MSPELLQFLPIIAIFGVMYFLILRPQMQERKEHEKLVASLTKGDRVVTASGLHGMVSEVAGDTVLLEIAEKTRIKVDKATVQRRLAATDTKDPK